MVQRARDGCWEREWGATASWGGGEEMVVPARESEALWDEAVTEEDNLDRPSSQCHQRHQALQVCQFCGRAKPSSRPTLKDVTDKHLWRRGAALRVMAIHDTEKGAAVFDVTRGRLAILLGCLLAKSHHESFPSSPVELLAGLKCCYAQVQPHWWSSSASLQLSSPWTAGFALLASPYHSNLLHTIWMTYWSYWSQQCRSAYTTTTIRLTSGVTQGCARHPICCRPLSTYVFTPRPPTLIYQHKLEKKSASGRSFYIFLVHTPVEKIQILPMSLGLAFRTHLQRRASTFSPLKVMLMSCNAGSP